MARENNDLNANDASEGENGASNASVSENSDSKQEPPKENPFSFKHFLRCDPSTSSSISHSHNANGNDQNPSNVNGLVTNSQQSPSKSATTSSLNSTGARPKIPQFTSVSTIHNNNDNSKMKRSPKFSSFDSQSSLSELADERNMHGSRSNNSFNMEYQFPSSRSYSNYYIEPVDGKQQHGSGMRFTPRSQSNVNNSSNSILPDFVQDHLLMEYYNNSSDSPSANMSPLSGDDFSLGNNEAHQNGMKRDPFDLTSFSSRSPGTRRRQTAIPLDLPIIDRSHRSAPSDLPPDLMENAASSNVAVQREETYGPHNEPEITRDQAAIDRQQTLPDFLSDGLIHSSGRLADVATINHDEDNQAIILRLQHENERLRVDLEESRRVIIDLEGQISHAKNLETQYNVTLAESMEQVEENLFASNQKAAEAHAQATKFKQQVKQLQSEVQHLRRDNESLRDGGAVGGEGAAATPSSNRTLSRDLRMAAASAENNLRQLLTGVENLRLIASTIENLDQPGSTNRNYLSDSDENEFNEGPAL